MSLAVLGSILEEMRLSVSTAELESLEDEFDLEYDFMGFGYCEDLEKDFKNNPEGVKKHILDIISIDEEKYQEIELWQEN